MTALKLTAQCFGGKHTWIMTQEQIKDAQDLGCAMCPTCGNPATVESVEVSTEDKRAKRSKPTLEDGCVPLKEAMDKAKKKLGKKKKKSKK